MGIMNKHLITLLLSLTVGNICFAGNKNLRDISIKIADYRMDKQCAVCYTSEDSITEHKTGVIPVIFPYQNNVVNDKNTSVCIAETRTFKPHRYAKSTDESLKDWIADLKINKDWGIALINGSAFINNSLTSDPVLCKHLDYIKNNEDDIWIGTFKEISSYIKQKEDIRLCVTYNKNSIIINPITHLEQSLFDESLTLVLERCTSKVNIKQNKKKIPFKYKEDKIIFEFNPYLGPIIISM